MLISASILYIIILNGRGAIIALAKKSLFEESLGGLLIRPIHLQAVPEELRPAAPEVEGVGKGPKWHQAL